MSIIAAIAHLAGAGLVEAGTVEATFLVSFRHATQQNAPTWRRICRLSAPAWIQ